MVYLDNAATTPLAPEVLDAMMPYLKYSYGNPGSLYSIGREAKKAVEQARSQVAEFLNAQPEQIVFTSGGSEANNTVFAGLYDFLLNEGRTHVITSQIEHDSVIESVKKMCIKHEFDASFIGVNEHGVVNPHTVASAFRENTGLVSVMAVNNETGAENDTQEIAGICREHGVLFHTDCVQAAGTVSLDTEKLGCDFLSISSHKLHGPKGMGALYMRDPDLLSPLICGGSHQEWGKRGGTENVAGIVGFGKACEMLTKRGGGADVHTSMLKQVFYNNLEAEFEKRGLSETVHVNGETIIHHGKTLNLRFDGVDAETLILMLDSNGICVSAGSACRSLEQEPSRVLTAMGLSDEQARQSIRVSFSVMNTEREVICAASVVAKCAEMLRR